MDAAQARRRLGISALPDARGEAPIPSRLGTPTSRRARGSLTFRLTVLVPAPRSSPGALPGHRSRAGSPGSGRESAALGTRRHLTRGRRAHADAGLHRQNAVAPNSGPPSQRGTLDPVHMLLDGWVVRCPRQVDAVEGGKGDDVARGLLQPGPPGGGPRTLDVRWGEHVFVTVGGPADRTRVRVLGLGPLALQSGSCGLILQRILRGRPARRRV